ncbi:MAG: hypothetical protein GY870_21565 [archaeon]|nr:hypothetical protein [archaeon]
MQEKKTEVKSPSHTHVPEKSCLNCNVKDYIDKENFVIKSYEELKDLCQKCDDLSNWEVLIEKMCTNCKSHDVDMSECLMNQHSDKICLKGELWELKIN